MEFSPNITVYSLLLQNFSPSVNISMHIYPKKRLFSAEAIFSIFYMLFVPNVASMCDLYADIARKLCTTFEEARLEIVLVKIEFLNAVMSLVFF